MVAVMCPLRARLSAGLLLALQFTLGLPFSPVLAGDPLPGQITADPENPRWLRYHEGGPVFIAGPGDPEDFLYQGTIRLDGTRDGGQLALIEKLKGTGANSIYFQAVRSHGGDGDKTHNPFIDHDPGKGINRAVLDQWEGWFREMDDNGIVIYFFFYDDGADPWNPSRSSNNAGGFLSKAGRRFKYFRHGKDQVSDDEKHFIETLVNRFEHHKHLIWVVAEEYNELFTPERVADIAGAIREADDHDHVIAVHKLPGLDFSEFAESPVIDQFAIQFNVSRPDELHKAMLTAWRYADGRYNLNMSEVAYGGIGTGAKARRNAWAIAMGGAYVMINGMDIATTQRKDLEDLGRLKLFMESTELHRMEPRDDLARDGTNYVLAADDNSYIAYASDIGKGKIGLAGLQAGTYRLRWLDVVDGSTFIQLDTIEGGDHSWEKPAGLGNEIVVYIRRT